MSIQIELIFEPLGNQEKVVIRQKVSAALSTIRDESLSQYLFVNREGVIIQSKYQANYTIENIMSNQNQIIMRNKGFMKPSKDKESPQSVPFEFFLNFSEENKKILIKAAENTNLEEISKSNQELEDYIFLNKNGEPIKRQYFKNYTVAEVINDKLVTVRKKQPSAQPKPQEKTFSIIFKNSKRQKIEIIVAESDTLSTIRKQDSLSNYAFVSKNGIQVSKNSENKVKISDIAINSVITMSPVDQKIESEMSEEKKKKIIQSQKQRLASINQSIKEVETLKSGYSKQENQKRMDEIAKNLKQKYNLLLPEKLQGIHELGSVIAKLQGEKSQCENIIEYAKKQFYSEAEMLSRNGGILSTVYLSKKKQNETILIVDFEKTPKVNYDKYKKNYKYSVIQYEVSEESSATVEFSKKSNYEFNGGQLKFSAYSISGKVSGGKADLEQTDCVTTKKSVKKGEKLHQLSLSFVTNQVIYFQKEKIALKKEVIENFEHIVSKFMEQKSIEKLRENINIFFDKYGVGVQSSLYYLGGVFKNVIKYTFNSNIQSEELTDILRKESEKKASGGISASSFLYSGEATFSHQDKGIGESSTGKNKLVKNTSYQSSFYHESEPLSSIKSVDKWTETMQSFPHNWSLVGHEEFSTVPITKLLKQKHNSIIMINQFLETKQKVFLLMDQILECAPFLFEFDENSKYFINGTAIKKGGQQFKEYQIIGKTGIPLNKKIFYTVQIIKSKMMNIAIGICSNSCKQNEYSQPKMDDVIYYKIEGKGKVETKKQQIKTNCVVKNKSIIKVIVDTRENCEGSITWEVNGKLIHKAEIPVEILQGGIYPYLHMLNDGDTVKIN